MDWDLRDGSERGCHISSVRQEMEKSREGSGESLRSPPLAKPGAMQLQVMAWEETQQLPSWGHRNAQQRGREEQSAGNPRAVIPGDYWKYLLSAH